MVLWPKTLETVCWKTLQIKPKPTIWMLKLHHSCPSTSKEWIQLYTSQLLDQLFPTPVIGTPSPWIAIGRMLPELRVRPPAIGRKRAKGRKWKKNGQTIENGPRVEIGPKMAKTRKMGRKWCKIDDPKSHFFHHFLANYLVPIFLIFSFWPVFHSTEAQKNWSDPKWLKSDSGRLTPKWPKIDSKVTPNPCSSQFWVTFDWKSLLSHFWVTFIVSVFV